MGRCKGLQSDKQGWEAVGQGKCQSLEGRGQMGEGACCNSPGKCRLLVPLPPFGFSRDPLLGATVGGVCSLASSQHANVFYKGLLPVCQTTPRRSPQAEGPQDGLPCSAWPPGLWHRRLAGGVLHLTEGQPALGGTRVLSQLGWRRPGRWG